MDPNADESIQMEPLIITSDRIEQFRKAAGLRYDVGMPATLATLFRESEFGWLEKLGIEMRDLLHTEQEYRYLTDFSPNDSAVAETKLVRRRDRKGLILVTLNTTIRSGDVVRVTADTSFVAKKTEDVEHWNNP